MTDDEIAGMLIGLLMAGQHTSSSTSSWLGLFLSHNKDIQTRCYEEQLQVWYCYTWFCLMVLQLSHCLVTIVFVDYKPNSVLKDAK